MFVKCREEKKDVGTIELLMTHDANVSKQGKRTSVAWQSLDASTVLTGILLVGSNLSSNKTAFDTYDWHVIRSFYVVFGVTAMPFSCRTISNGNLEWKLDDVVGLIWLIRGQLISYELDPHIELLTTYKTY